MEAVAGDHRFVPASVTLAFKLGNLLALASGGKAASERIYEERVGEGVQGALNKQFENYNLRGQAWADLTRSLAKEEGGGTVNDYVNQDGRLVAKLRGTAIRR